MQLRVHGELLVRLEISLTRYSTAELRLNEQRRPFRVERGKFDEENLSRRCRRAARQRRGLRPATYRHVRAIRCPAGPIRCHLFCSGLRSEERRVGKEWVSTCRCWGSP